MGWCMVLVVSASAVVANDAVEFVSQVRSRWKHFEMNTWILWNVNYETLEHELWPRFFPLPNVFGLGLEVSRPIELPFAPLDSSAPPWSMKNGNWTSSGTHTLKYFLTYVFSSTPPSLFSLFFSLTFFLFYFNCWLVKMFRKCVVWF